MVMGFIVINNLCFLGSDWVVIAGGDKVLCCWILVICDK